MTTNAPLRVATWHRRLVRPLPPFPTTDAALESIGFAPDDDMQLESGKEVYFLPSELLSEGINPRLGISIDAGQIETATGISVDTAELVISLRNVASRNYQAVARWPIKNIPDTWRYDPTSQRRIISHEGFDLVVTVCLSDSLQKQQNKPYRRGSVLARKTFSVKPEVDAVSFPIKLVDFGNDALFKNWPEETLWVVDYFDPEPDFNKSVESVLQVLLNKRAEEKLRVLTVGSSAGAILMKVMAAEFFLEIAVFALQAPETESDVDKEESEMGLRSQVLASLSESSGRSSDELISWAEGPNHGRLRAEVQRMFGIAQSVLEANLRRSAR